MPTDRIICTYFNEAFGGCNLSIHQCPLCEQSVEPWIMLETFKINYKHASKVVKLVVMSLTLMYMYYGMIQIMG